VEAVSNFLRVLLQIARHAGNVHDASSGLEEREESVARLEGIVVVASQSLLDDVRI
jgi:hypothetical protein